MLITNLSWFRILGSLKIKKKNNNPQVTWLIITPFYFTLLLAFSSNCWTFKIVLKYFRQLGSLESLFTTGSPVYVLISRGYLIMSKSLFTTIRIIFLSFDKNISWNYTYIYHRGVSIAKTCKFVTLVFYCAHGFSLGSEKLNLKEKYYCLLRSGSLNFFSCHFISEITLDS